MLELHEPGMLGPVPGRRDSDKSYLLDLCDEVLRSPGSRQYRFDWQLGDPGKNGHRVRLPVDGYWPEEALVVEYRERQHDVPVRHFDKPERLTVSGVHRGAQRRIYDEGRERSIPEQGLRLVIVKPDALVSTAEESCDATELVIFRSFEACCYPSPRSSSPASPPGAPGHPLLPRVVTPSADGAAGRRGGPCPHGGYRLGRPVA